MGAGSVMEVRQRIERQLAFVREADRLKEILRLSRVGARRENDAEHSWHLALMAIVLAEHAADPGVDLLRVVKMVVVHDLVEIDAGDLSAYAEPAQRERQAERERLAAERIFGILPEPHRGELRELWLEFEARATPEARFARALDRLQPLLQNYHSQGASWREHGVRTAQVQALNQPVIGEGAPRLWAYVEELIDDATRRGWLAR